LNTKSLERGFTLIEVLVALVLVSLLSLLAWRALDGMGRAGEFTLSNEQSLQRVQTGLAQWTADLDAVTDAGLIQPLDFDGQRLRLTRQSSEPNAGIVVVAWLLRTTEQGRVLQRWASPPVTTRVALQAAWDQAERWSRTPQPEDVVNAVTLMPVSSWQLFYYRGDAWSNPQSSAGGSATDASTKLPDGVQLILDLPAGVGDGSIAGKLTRYWIAPRQGATR
jgi:general secretion pathway protein J